MRTRKYAGLSFGFFMERVTPAKNDSVQMFAMMTATKICENSIPPR